MLRHIESYVPDHYKNAAASGGQQGLFDQPLKPEPDRAPSRKSDPATSRLAAANVVRSGRASARNQKILAFLGVCDEDFTYREIGVKIGEDPTEVMRRLNTLRKKGLVEKCGCRRCSINGNEMTTWRAKR